MHQRFYQANDQTFAWMLNRRSVDKLGETLKYLDSRIFDYGS